jgi:hypothetical protein
MIDSDRTLRAEVYCVFAETGRAPSFGDLATSLGLTEPDVPYRGPLPDDFIEIGLSETEGGPSWGCPPFGEFDVEARALRESRGPARSRPGRSEPHARPGACPLGYKAPCLP